VVLFLTALLACAVAQPLNIYLLAHTHDDPGWLRTIDEYYIYEVQYIFDSVLDSLTLNPDRKFIEVEVTFFARWWNEQSEARKAQTRRVVENGQLEFINGGWCMNDEAVPIYYSMIDQMTLGHEFLQNAFGDAGKPTIGWHIDPFGHSNVQSTLYKWTGFDAFFINRIDYREQATLKAARDMEFWWQGSPSVGTESAMWTHLLSDHYCTPNGFNWEHGVTQDLPDGDGPPPIIIDPPSWGTSSNALERAQLFVTEAKRRAAFYKTNNVVIPFGCDFTFQNANMMFKNMDRLIETINTYSDLLGATARYSSLSDYAAAAKAANASWITRTQDFFPYADNGGSYWTGYFTSRPELKSISRRADGLLRNADFMYSLALSEFGFVLNKASFSELNLLRAPNAVAQHHDGITGTWRQIVGDDYKLRLLDGIRRGEAILGELLGQFITDNSFNPYLDRTWERLSTEIAAGRNVPTVVYNSLPWARRIYVNNTITTPNVAVYDVNGNAVPYQINPQIRGGRYTLWFLADLPALGYVTYIISPLKDKSLRKENMGKTYTLEEVQFIENEYVWVDFNNSTGLMTTFLNKRTGSLVNLVQNFWEYDSYNFPQSSGAYIFRPTGTASVLSGTVQTTVIVGPYLSVVQQVFGNGVVVQEIRLFKGLDFTEGSYLDIEATVGPLAYDQEIITRFQSNIQSGSTFYSDNNGFEIQRRENIPGGRPGDLDNGVRIAGNYYPAVSRGYIKDSTRDNVLVYASQSTHGIASLANGELEIMLHRRCSRDDSRGMNEALNDQTQYIALLRLTVDTSDESTRFHQKHSKTLSFPPAVFYGLSSNYPGWVAHSRNFLNNPLPENVFLLSFNPRDSESDQITLRLFNSFERGSHSSLAQPVTVNLRTLFRDFVITSAEERTLTLLNPLPQQPADLSNIVVDPIEIRTFVVQVAKN